MFQHCKLGMFYLHHELIHDANKTYTLHVMNKNILLILFNYK